MTTTHRATAYAAGEAELPTSPANPLRRLLDALSAWRRCRAASAELQAQHHFVRRDMGLPPKMQHDPEHVRQWLSLEWH